MKKLIFLISSLFILSSYSAENLNETRAKIKESMRPEKNYQWISSIFNKLEINEQAKIIKLFDDFKKLIEETLVDTVSNENITGEKFFSLISLKEVKIFFSLVGSHIEEMKVWETITDSGIAFLNSLELILKKNYEENISIKKT